MSEIANASPASKDADRIRAKDYWSFADLVVIGIVNSRSALSHNISKRGFPSPIYLGTRTAVYPADQVRAWIDARQAVKPIVPPQLAEAAGRAA